MPRTLTGLIRKLGGPLQRRDHHRGRAVADQRTIVDGQRLGDRLAGQSLLHRDDFAHVRQRILRPVGVILDRDRGQLLPGGAVLIHVPPRDHREQRREGRAGPNLAAISPAPARISVTLGVVCEVIFSTPATRPRRTIRPPRSKPREKKPSRSMRRPPQSACMGRL